MNNKFTNLVLGSFFAIAASLSFGAGTVFASGPSVITSSATPTTTTATLSGAYDIGIGVSGGANTKFDWGQRAGATCTVGDLTNSTSYISYTDSSRTFTKSISGLTPSTAYCFRAFASNSSTGPGYGSVLPFTTTSTGGGTSAPSVITSSASQYGVGGYAETLNGAFNGYGDTTRTKFLWGTSSSSLVNEAPVSGFVTQSATSGSFSAIVTGLTPSTRYYFQAVAQTAGGTTYGSILPFTTGGSTGADCTIDAFTASNTTVASGASVTLSWTTVGCTSGTINNGVGSATPIANGSVSSGSLTGNTTFTLTATDGTHYAYKNVTVTVTGGGTSSCTLSSFYAAPSTVSYAGGTTMLYWSASSGCTSLSISPSIGNVTGTTSANTNAIYGTTTYTLTGYDSTGAPRTLTTTVTYSGGGGTGSCSIDSFYATPATVSYGGSSTLYWNTSGCVSASLSGLFASGLSGSVNTGALYTTTTYTITAYDSSGASRSSNFIVGVTTGTTGTGTTTWGTTGSGYCVINSFYASPATVSNGQSTMLYWNSSGCSSLSLQGGTTYYSTHIVSPNGSESTGTLYGTSVYTLIGNGGSSASQSTTVYVTNSPYPYQYTCGTYSYDPSCNSQYSSGVITSVPTNVGTNSARLNGIVSGIDTTFAAYFEYGTTPSLGQATPFQNLLATRSSLALFDTITVVPNTTYYYRMVAQINGSIVRGNILSFTSQGRSSTNIVYVGGSSNTNGNSGNTGGTTTTQTATGVTLTVTNQQEKFNVGDTVNYTVTYTNGSNKTLSNSILTFILPMGFTVKATTQGVMQPPTMVTANLGTLAVGQTGSLFIQAEVQSNVATDQTLVTNATLAYTLPNGTHDSAVGYVLNHAQVQNVFAGFALGSGFFPSTIFGWLFTAIIILIIILISRRIARAKHGGHDDHGHGDHGHAAPKH